MINLLDIFDILHNANKKAGVEVSIRVRGDYLQFDAHRYGKGKDYRLILSRTHCEKHSGDFAAELNHFVESLNKVVTESEPRITDPGLPRFICEKCESITRSSHNMAGSTCLTCGGEISEIEGD